MHSRMKVRTAKEETAWKFARYGSHVLDTETDLHTLCVGLKLKIEKGVHSCLFGKLYVIIYAQNKFIEMCQNHDTELWLCISTELQDMLELSFLST